jgi:hypothetical protein
MKVATQNKEAEESAVLIPMYITTQNQILERLLCRWIMLNLAPSNFFLFSKLKMKLEGRRF